MKNGAILIAISFLTVFNVNSAFSRSDGPPLGRTNAPPNEANCQSCHSTFSLDSGDGSIEIDAPESYLPGKRYDIAVRLSDPNGKRWGFELTALDRSNSKAGTLISIDEKTDVLDRLERQYVRQTSIGTFAGQSEKASWNFEWIAPESGAGELEFYFIGNAANNDSRKSGDRIYSGRFTTKLIETKWDLNGDKIVDIFDLVLVANQFGTDGSELTADVNNDRTVDIFDLVFVAWHFGEDYHVD